jgi:hypothetical protein
MNSNVWILSRNAQGVRIMARTTLQAPPQTPLEQVLASAEKDGTVSSVASLTGVTKKAVSQILRAGLPLMAKEADDHPMVFKAMFQQSLRPAPDSTAAFYEALQTNITAQLSMQTAFRSMYGPKTDAFNREAGQHANTTEQQAGQVLAVTMPVLLHSLALLNHQRNEMGFGGLLRRLRA